jgi:ferric-dicitrate binding protein FerR (iron transport regulator)
MDGEAYFEVAHDKNHPFTVRAGGVQTTVLGTRFNIKAYRALPLTRVSVFSGKVKVEDSLKNLAVLTRSRQLLYNKENRIANSSSIDTGSILAWKSGQLKFEGETFTEIASAMESWYGVKIIFAGQSIKGCRYYLNIEQTVSLEKFLSLLSEITDMEYAIDKKENTVTISGKGCE